MRTPSTSRLAASQATRRLRAITTLATRASASSGVEIVHDLRVAIRQFRRILSVLKACYPRRESRQLRAELKAIMAFAGDVRDHDAAIALIREAAGSKYRGIVTEIRHNRDTAAQALRASLREWKKNGSSAAWRHALRSAPPHATAPADSTAREILPAMATQHFRRGRDASREDAPMETLHRFRIAAKNLRYTLDAFADVYGDSIDEVMHHLKGAQKLVGEIHDCAVARRMVAGAKTSTGKKEIRTALKKRQHRKTERFQREFGCEFSNAATLRHWKKSLA